MTSTDFETLLHDLLALGLIKEYLKPHDPNSYVCLTEQGRQYMRQQYALVKRVEASK